MHQAELHRGRRGRDSLPYAYVLPPPSGYLIVSANRPSSDLKLQFQNEGKSKAKAEMEELFKITGRNDDAGFPPDISFSKRRDETMGPKEASIAHHGGSY